MSEAKKRVRLRPWGEALGVVYDQPPLQDPESLHAGHGWWGCGDWLIRGECPFEGANGEKVPGAPLLVGLRDGEPVALLPPVRNVAWIATAPPDQRRVTDE